MFDQPLLPGFAPLNPKNPCDDLGRSAVTHAIFFAIFPEGDAAMRARALAQDLCREHRLAAMPLAVNRLHVSLAGFGQFPRVPRKLVRLVCDAASAIAVKAFDVSFDRVVSFGKADSRHAGKRPVVLRCGDGLAELIGFQDKLSSALAGIGLFPKRTSAFEPHLTLLYDRASIAERFIESIRWTVREFRLVDSLRGRTLHVPLGRWRLQHGSSGPPA